MLKALIFVRISSLTPVVLGLDEIIFHKGSEAGIAAARKSPPNTISVAAHGSNRRCKDERGKEPKVLYVDDLAKIITSDPSYDPKKTIRLNICNAGFRNDSLGQELSKKIPNKVEAPSDAITVRGSDYTWFGGGYSHHSSTIDNGGTWRGFLNGIEVK